MQHTIDYDDGGLGPATEAVVRIIREEFEAIMSILPHALARQWSASPAPRADAAPSRASGDRSDPTADVALDPRRLEVRETVNRVEKALRATAVVLRGSRMALERAVSRYDGEARR